MVRKKLDLGLGAGQLPQLWQNPGVLRLKVAVTVPFNTTAEVVIPAASELAVREENVPAVSVSGVKKPAFKEGRLTLLVGSGHYEIAVRSDTP